MKVLGWTKYRSQCAVQMFEVDFWGVENVDGHYKEATSSVIRTFLSKFVLGCSLGDYIKRKI